jgi:hypothetical protein
VCCTGHRPDTMSWADCLSTMRIASVPEDTRDLVERTDYQPAAEPTSTAAGVSSRPGDPPSSHGLGSGIRTGAHGHRV